MGYGKSFCKRTIEENSTKEEPSFGLWLRRQLGGRQVVMGKSTDDTPGPKRKTQTKETGDISEGVLAKFASMTIGEDVSRTDQ